jgi:Zn finger protein HypA/HybF involved in hydrogenase expression
MSSLPYGTDWSFTNKFPYPSIFSFLFISEDFCEYRRQRLEEWLRELCLDERCMTNEGILTSLYTFIKAQDNGGPVGISSQPQISATYKRYMLPSNEVIEYPLRFEALLRQLPCYIKSNSLIGRDTTLPLISDDQVMKDMERDRIVIQGKRLVGSHFKFGRILNISVETLEQILYNAVQSSVITKQARAAITNQHMKGWCTECLKRASRTDSASACHNALLQLMTLEDAVIVPESSLAKPIELHFFLKVKAKKLTTPNKKAVYTSRQPPAESFSIVCDIRNTTVYRIADIETLDTKLQLAITFYSITYGLIVYESQIISDVEEACENRNTAAIVFERETTTTTRDW